MKVWLVKESALFEEWYVLGVFSSEKSAKEFIRKRKETISKEEWGEISLISREYEVKD